MRTGGAVRGSESTNERGLAALTGLRREELREILQCVAPIRSRSGELRYRWRDVAPFLGREQLWHARKKVLATRVLAHGSRYWLAGYPRLLAQWHPVKNVGLRPDEISHGSGRKVWWKCDRAPDHEWRAVVANRTRRRGTGCPFCRGKRASVGNNLADFAPEVAALWHPTRNGRLTPRDVTGRSNRIVWWKCPAARDHEWRAHIANRVQWRGCPFCSGQRLSVTNSLATRVPAIAKQWHPTRNRPLTPRDVIAGSRRRVWWKCPKAPDHVWQTSVADRTSRRTGCPMCLGKRRSHTNSFAALFPALASQWHPSRNGHLQPTDVARASSTAVWWKCPKAADHEWRAAPNTRAKSPGCPFCVGRRASRSESLATCFPKIAREWHPTRNGEVAPRDVRAISQQPAWWRCKRGHVWRSLICQRTQRGTGCPRCRRLGHARQP
jgi:hypothetical protein